MGLSALVRKSVAASCLYYLVDDWRAGRRLAAGKIETTSGARHLSLSVGDSVAYIRNIYSDYLTYGGVERLGGRIAEIGPGDNFGLALMLLANGAEEVDAIDRYYSQRDPEAQRAIYQALAAEETAESLFDSAPGETTMRGLSYHPGIAAEDFFAERAASYDGILSRAVLEHLYDPIGALDDMARALKPGGRLIHRIDLRDHGMFAGHHPLTFLTIAESWYRRMTRQSGRPNRVLVHQYRDWLDNSGLDGNIRITRLAGVEGEFGPSAWSDIPTELRDTALASVRQIRPRLASPLDKESDEDLAVAGIVLTAKA